jgi:chaperone modulatory protein CbpM
MAKHSDTLSGTLLDEELEISLAEICTACSIDAERLLELVAEGILEPCSGQSTQWRFPGSSLARVKTCLRLQRDLDLNLAGAALALELLEQNRRLRNRLQVLEQALDAD